jgi:hypothetical protein
LTDKTSKKYSQTSLEEAVKQVKAGMSYRRATQYYGVPSSTLLDKIKGYRPLVSTQGPSPVLTIQEEQKLAKWCVDMAAIGYGRTRNELLDMVKKILDSEGRSSPFTNNRPGKDWYYAFLRRNPSISERTPMQLGKERARIQPAQVSKWFDDFHNYVNNIDAQLLQDPSRIYNADESGFSLCPKSGRVIAPKGTPTVYNFTSSDKTQLTLLACASATAHYIKPMLVFPGQRFSYNPLKGMEQDAYLGRSLNGWMDSELFFTWLKEVFIPEINTRQVKRPVLLLVDGHFTHLTLESSKLCSQENIILYCLLEHASHLMQPLDLTLFSSLKESWKQSVRSYQADHPGELVTKMSFAQVVYTYFTY